MSGAGKTAPPGGPVTARAPLIRESKVFAQAAQAISGAAASDAIQVESLGSGKLGVLRHGISLGIEVRRVQPESPPALQRLSISYLVRRSDGSWRVGFVST